MSQRYEVSSYQEAVDMIADGDIPSGITPVRKRNWLPRYVYHFTEMKNIINILSNEYIYSRNEALKQGLMSNDNASDEVITSTNDKWKSHVRFYFRPKTPTQYNNEGIRSNNTRSPYNAHCPLPVFMMFNSVSMLELDNSVFSQGNLASTSITYDSPQAFANMPFEKIFHEGSYDPQTQGDIKFHRHAELAVQDACSLEHLKCIVCRSAAEKETFMHILDNNLVEKYRNIIVVDTRSHLFNGKWTYIESSNLMRENIVLNINVGIWNPVFEAFLKIKELGTNKVYTWHEANYEPVSVQNFNLNNLEDSSVYEVEFYLDDHLAFKSAFVDVDDLPF